MLKILSGAVVFLGCGYLGILFSKRFKNRVTQLAEMQRVMTELEHCIEFLGMTVADALAVISKNCDTELKLVFMYVAERLKSSPGSNMEGVWQRGIDKYRQALILNNEDIEIIINFSKNLGLGNREKEKNNIRVTLMRLKLAEDEARAELEQNSKMYRGLGFLFGIFVVIVLI